MNTFANSVSRFARIKIAIAAAAIALGAVVTPVGLAAAAPSQFAASIPLGPLTVPHMRAQCWASWHTVNIYRVGVHWRCNRPFGVDPIVNYNAACKRAYHNATAFAGAPNAFGMRRCFRPLPLVANP
jgi:hypothetical protein